MTPEDLMRRLIARAHAPEDMIEPALAIIRDAERSALQRAAEVQPFSRLLGAINHVGQTNDAIDLWIGGNFVGSVTVAQWRALISPTPTETGGK